MNENDLYEAIFKRKSIRNYDSAQLDQKRLEETKEVRESSSLEFIILMSFGNSKEAIYRTDVSQFKRKPLSEITNIEGADELLEPARLAPSAINLQNWYFTGDKNLIHAYSFKPGFLRGIVGGSYFPVNVGIAICHLQLAAEHLGWKTRIVFEKETDKNPPKDREYVASEIEKAPVKNNA